MENIENSSRDKKSDEMKRKKKKPKRLIEDDDGTKSPKVAKKGTKGPAKRIVQGNKKAPGSKKKQPKGSLKKSKSPSQPTSKGKKGKKGSKKKEKKVKRSGVLVIHKRPMPKSNLDSAWKSKISPANSLISAALGRQSQPIEEQRGAINPSDIGANLLTAVRDRQRYYMAGTQIREVPITYQFRTPTSSPTTGNGRRIAGIESNRTQDTLSVERSPSNNQHQLSTPTQSTTGCAQNATPQRPVQTQPNVADRAVTFESVVSRIPQHILVTTNRGTQAIYILKLVYTKQQIIRSSVTGKKSEYASFAENFGEHTWNVYTAVMREKFGIAGPEISSLLSKKINYLRHSSRILRCAKEKRIANRAARLEREREENGFGVDVDTHGDQQEEEFEGIHGNNYDDNEIQENAIGVEEEEDEDEGVDDDEEDDVEGDEDEEDDEDGVDDDEEEEEYEDDEEEEEDGDSSNVESDDSSGSETVSSSDSEDDKSDKPRRKINK